MQDEMEKVWSLFFSSDEECDQKMFGDAEELVNRTIEQF